LAERYRLPLLVGQGKIRGLRSDFSRHHASITSVIRLPVPATQSRAVRVSIFLLEQVNRSSL
jgi:hypothetical protein